MCRTRSRSWPAASAFSRSSPSLGHSRPWNEPPRHEIADAAMIPSGVPPTPSSRSTSLSWRAAAIAPATSPSVMKRMRPPASRILLHQAVVTRPVEDDDGDVREAHALALRDRAQVVLHGGVDVDDVGVLRPDRELLHVEHGRGVEHRAPLGDGEDGERVRHALGHERGAVDGVDRDVALRAVAVADLLAVVEHRRLVLLALADDHRAPHRHRADELAHRVDGRPVAAVLVPAPDEPARRHRGRLRHPHEFEREVAIGGLGATGCGGGLRGGHELSRRTGAGWTASLPDLRDRGTGIDRPGAGR